MKHRIHQSIKLTWQNLLFLNPFTFSETTESDIEREILELNSKRLVRLEISQQKYEKESCDVCYLALEIYGIMKC